MKICPNNIIEMNLYPNSEKIQINKNKNKKNPLNDIQGQTLNYKNFFTYFFLDSSCFKQPTEWKYTLWIFTSFYDMNLQRPLRGKDTNLPESSFLFHPFSGYNLSPNPTKKATAP